MVYLFARDLTGPASAPPLGVLRDPPDGARRLRGFVGCGRLAQSPRKLNCRKRYGPSGSRRISAPSSMVSIRFWSEGCATTKFPASSHRCKVRSAVYFGSA